MMCDQECELNEVGVSEACVLMIARQLRRYRSETSTHLCCTVARLRGVLQ
jgi:hypothetical protein